MMSPSPELDTLLRLALALGIGLLIGLERGWKERAQKDAERIAGWRSFGLLGLLGGIAALLGETGAPVLPMVLLAIAGLFGIAYWHDIGRDNHWSITTSLAAATTVCLGALATGPFAMQAAAAAVVVAILLASRDRMHGALRRLSPDDLHATLRFLLIALVVLPWLPDRGFGPYGLLNPHRLWFMVVLISGLSFAGYVAIRLFGSGKGVALTAIAGGLVSSTAVTFTLSRLAGEDIRKNRLLAGGVVLACTIMPLRMMVIIGAIHMTLLQPLWPALLLAALVGLAWSAWLLRDGFSGAELPLAPGNPLQLGSAIAATVAIAIITILIKLIYDRLGDSGVVALSALAGVLDVDAMTLSNASLARNSLATAVAAHAILAGALSNSIFKAGFTTAVAPRSMWMPVCLAMVTICLIVALFIFLF